MPEQLDIFGNATPFPTGREVRAGERGGSAAAARIPDKPEHYVNLLALFEHRDRADFDLVLRLPDVHPGTLSKRRLRLERAGLLEEVPGEFHTTPYGSDAMVFTITDKGRRVLTEWTA